MNERTPEYEIYHKKIVEILVSLTGEENRWFWDVACDYLDEFAEGEQPEDVAQAQIECMDE